ncbi:MAG TPA: hypothetical protein VGJ91_21125, partial [Polyangiaceae bacterium]
MATAAATVALGVLFSTCGAGSVLAAREQTEKTARAAASASAELTRQAEAKRALVGQLPEKVKGWQGALSIAKGLELAEAIARTTHVQQDIDVHSKMLGDAPPEALTAIATDAAKQLQDLNGRQQLLDKIRQVGLLLQDAKTQAAKQNWLEADGACSTVLNDLVEIQSAPESLKPYVPVDFDPKKARDEAVELRRRIAAPLAQAVAQRDREEKARKAAEAKLAAKREADEAKAAAKKKAEEIEAAATAAVCGDKPTVSGWDG